MTSTRDARIAQLFSMASDRGFFITGAESITGGLVSSELTRIPGASKVFLGAFVTYSDAFKLAAVQVSPALLQMQGAVDPEVCAQMANGARGRASRNSAIPEERIVSFATTGEAGPVPSSAKPIGRVYTALLGCMGALEVRSWDFSGTRDDIRSQAADAVIDLLLEQIKPISGFPLS